MPPAKRVSVDQSALYKIRSHKRLAKILLCDPSLLDHLASSKSNYMEFSIGERWIENPKPALKNVQRRFAKLLSQVETPAYLHSSVKGRSYITNATPHTADHPSIKVDIKKFFPSARSAEVYRFLVDVLKWEKDVAGVGVKLLCHNGHLPTGGNASPIISYWAYKPLFDEVSELADELGCEFSLYVDDMTLTGSLASRKLMYSVRKVVSSHRLKAHKFHHFARGRTKIVTGVAQTKYGPRLPFARQAKIYQIESDLIKAPNRATRLALMGKLVGRICEAAEVDRQTWGPRAIAAVRKYKKLSRKVLRGGVVTPSASLLIPEVSTNLAPWDEPSK